MNLKAHKKSPSQTRRDMKLYLTVFPDLAILSNYIGRWRIID